MCVEKSRLEDMNRFIKPIFTIVIPYFEAEDTIETAIKSVLAQSFENFELIVVDDGSPIDGIKRIETIFNSDYRCKVVRTENMGPSHARNFGAFMGTGKIIAFLDSDDRWDERFLTLHHRHIADDSRIGISFSRVRFMDDKMLKGGSCSAYKPEVLLWESVAENACCTTSNIVVKRTVFERVGGFNKSLSYAEDQELVARVLATTSFTVKGIPEILVDYRTSLNGLSADIEKMEEGWLSLIETIRRSAGIKSFCKTEIIARSIFYRYLARRALRVGRPPILALSYFHKAVMADLGYLLMNEPKRTIATAVGIMLAFILPKKLSHRILSR